MTTTATPGTATPGTATPDASTGTAERAAVPAADVCPPSAVQLSSTAVDLGTQDGWDAAVSGVAVDEKYV